MTLLVLSNERIEKIEGRKFQSKGPVVGTIEPLPDRSGINVITLHYSINLFDIATGQVSIPAHAIASLLGTKGITWETIMEPCSSDIAEMDIQPNTDSLTIGDFVTHWLRASQARQDHTAIAHKQGPVYRLLELLDVNCDEETESLLTSDKTYGFIGIEVITSYDSDQRILRTLKLTIYYLNYSK